MCQIKVIEQLLNGFNCIIYQYNRITPLFALFKQILDTSIILDFIPLLQPKISLFSIYLHPKNFTREIIARTTFALVF